MKVAALPSLRLSRSSSVLWPPPIPCPALLPRFRVLPLCASLPCGAFSAGPNRVSPVNLMYCLCVPPSSTPSRPLGSLLAVLRAVAGFASGEQARPGNKSSCIGVIAGGVNDAETTFTSVAARRFASPSCRQLKALSSRFSIADCSAAEGIRLSGERVITRVDSSQSTSSSSPLGRTPRDPAGVRRRPADALHSAAGFSPDRFHHGRCHQLLGRPGGC